MEICDKGTIEYENALNFQKEMLQRRVRGEISDMLILAEHYPVVTFGRVKDEENILSKASLEDDNISIFFSNRGGKITYHAPGQLLLYPIIDLRKKKRDVRYYIDFLEKMAVKSLKCLGVPAKRKENERGVWVSGKKIAFTGISLKNWVTFHGIAVNINNDITPFSYINPCGEKNIEVTSLKEVLGEELSMTIVKKIFVKSFLENMEIEYNTK
ncbi:MAG: lipoyl(octanoyl) transferase LipB [Candidatus Omnitrophota bacterium]|nr:lipoyl(octanoyl) transferase LipB [Candidatus Omnitrophota bacterium]MBU1894406.1 lipoyl(octanoyl) transferase LipB [Candidatus Omnitrophota bacterium]